MTISVIVKGNRFEAAQAASERKIPFAFQNEILTEGFAPMTRGLVSDEYDRAVRLWFSEPNDQCTPYPVGTCLLFNSSPDDKRIVSPAVMYRAYTTPETA